MASQTLRETEEKVRKSIDALRKELAIIRSGHASPALVEHVRVDYAGVPTPLIQLAAISAPEARLLIIQPWNRSYLPSIEKAILKSDLGLTPLNDGTKIRLNIPSLTEERRQEMVKLVRKRVEEGKITIRNIRRDGLEELKELKKNKGLSEDDYKRSSDQLQKLTDSFIAAIDEIRQNKEVELAEG